ALVRVLRDAVGGSGLPADAVQLVPGENRDSVQEPICGSVRRSAFCGPSPVRWRQPCTETTQLLLRNKYCASFLSYLW
ncbi:hypothetical protein, partial [Streptomyces sp. NPDC005167]